MSIESYTANITSEHRDKPKFMGWLTQNLNIIDDIYNVLKGMDSTFDIDNAVGVQLDVLGVLIGKSRTLDFQPLNGNNPVLDDDTYRLVLKAKIAQNNWDGTINQIYELWNNIFSDIKLQIVDNQDMSFAANIIGYVNQARQDLIQEGCIVPRPEGVKIIYTTQSYIDLNSYSGMAFSGIQNQILNLNGGGV